MRSRSSSGRKREAGQAVLVVAVWVFIFVLGFLGLAVDMGYLRYMKRKMQTAADAAAIAGGGELLYTDLTSAAQAASAANGFTDGTNGVTVTVNHGPASGPHANDSNYVEVIVSQNQPTFFMKALKVSSVPLSARAVAFASSPNCIYALDPSAQNALTVNGILIFVQSRCGVYVNSNNSRALTMQGFFNSLRASSISVVGGYNAGFLNFISPTPATGVPPATDPLASLAAPSVGLCDYVNFAPVGNVTLNPGVYCGGINISAVTGTATFNSGMYILNGGGLTINGTFSATTGSGVTFYNTDGGPTYPYGPINVQGLLATVNFSAPTTGPYAGILFFQDRNVTSASANTVQAVFSGSTLEGAMYFPTTAVNFWGLIGGSRYTILVAKTISYGGFFAFFNDDYSSLPGGSPIKNTGVLVE